MSDLLRRFVRSDAVNHLPAFQLGNRRSLLDPYSLAFPICGFSIVGMIFLRAANDLTIERVFQLTLYFHQYGLVSLVGNQRSRQHALGHGPSSYFVSAELSRAGWEQRHVGNGWVGDVRVRWVTH